MYLPVMEKLSTVKGCDACGCTDVKEYTVGSMHTNGNRNESVTFQCGRKIAFSPNFMRIVDEVFCRHDPTFSKRRDDVDSFRKEIFSLAEERGLDKRDIKKLKDQLEFWNVSSWA